MKPVVSALKEKIAGKLEFSEGSGAEASKYGVRYIPTMVFAAADGTELQSHVGMKELDTLIQGLNGLGANLK